MSVNRDKIPATVVAESLVASISEIIKSLASIEQEEEHFTEIGCYIYRASLVIMELYKTDNTPENATEILQSLSGSIDSTRDLINNRGIDSGSDSEKGTLVKLEGVIRQMGKSLRSIPSSTFQEEEYVRVAVRSLADEMQNASFEFRQTQEPSTEALEPPMSKTQEEVKEGLSRTGSEQEESVELAVQSLADEMQNACFEVSQTRELPTEVLEPPRSITLEEVKEGALRTESDLHSMNVEAPTEDSRVLNMLHLNEILKTTNFINRRKQNSSDITPSPFPQMAEYLEPQYVAFCCPLTKQIMDNPVTIESGVTYERKAITEWFEEFEDSEEIFCPITKKKLSSTALRGNLALKTTIDEWRERNEAARIKVCRAALSLASSTSMVLDAMNDLQVICKGKQFNMTQVMNAGIPPLLVKLLQHKDRNVISAALVFLRQLAEGDEGGKELITKILDISTVIKLLSSNHQPLRHAALVLLLELSSFELFCEKFGSIPGGILMLIRIKYNQSLDSFASKVADETLRNLERCVVNIKNMAENGLLEPLIDHLSEGSEELQMEMASYLGEVALGHDSKTYVAERASPALIKMVHTGNSLTRKAAFKALAEISSYQPNAKILTEVGIVQIMVKEIFNRRIHNEPMNSTNEAAAILANIFEAGIDFQNIQGSSHGHKFTSEYVLHNIISMLKNTTPDELNVSLLRIILCMTKFSKSMELIVSVVKETEASYNLIELLNNHHEQLAVAATKLLIALTPYMGNTLVEGLCKTRGQPENLILGCTETRRITEKQAVSAKFLATLPHKNVTLNLALLSKSTVPRILQLVDEIRRTGARTSRHASPYLEGLVGVLVRFTTTLNEPQILQLAQHYHFTLVFTELLMEKSSDEIQRLSATGLENLSSESTNLSRPPPPPLKETKLLKLFCFRNKLSASTSRRKKPLLCPVHKGACSSQNTFCLIDAKAMDRLLACLEHENVEVIEAALSAICTLLDDRVDVDNSVSMLSEMSAIQHVLNVVKEHKRESLTQKSFWFIERFLMKGGDQSASDISQDRLFLAALVGTFHHGDGNARQMAEKILRCLNKMPKFPTSNHTM